MFHRYFPLHKMLSIIQPVQTNTTLLKSSNFSLHWTGSGMSTCRSSSQMIKSTLVHVFPNFGAVFSPLEGRYSNNLYTIGFLRFSAFIWVLVCQNLTILSKVTAIFVTLYPIRKFAVYTVDLTLRIFDAIFDGGKRQIFYKGIDLFTNNALNIFWIQS